MQKYKKILIINLFLIFYSDLFSSNSFEVKFKKPKSKSSENNPSFLKKAILPLAVGATGYWLGNLLQKNPDKSLFLNQLIGGITGAIGGYFLNKIIFKPNTSPKNKPKSELPEPKTEDPIPFVEEPKKNIPTLENRENNLILNFFSNKYQLTEAVNQNWETSYKFNNNEIELDLGKKLTSDINPIIRLIATQKEIEDGFNINDRINNIINAINKTDVNALNNLLNINSEDINKNNSKLITLKSSDNNIFTINFLNSFAERKIKIISSSKQIYLLYNQAQNTQKLPFFLEQPIIQKPLVQGYAAYQNLNPANPAVSNNFFVPPANPFDNKNLQKPDLEKLKSDLTNALNRLTENDFNKNDLKSKLMPVLLPFKDIEITEPIEINYNSGFFLISPDQKCLPTDNNTRLIAFLFTNKFLYRLHIIKKDNTFFVNDLKDAFNYYFENHKETESNFYKELKKAQNKKDSELKKIEINPGIPPVSRLNQILPIKLLPNSKSPVFNYDLEKNYVADFNDSNTLYDSGNEGHRIPLMLLFSQKERLNFKEPHNLINAKIKSLLDAYQKENNEEINNIFYNANYKTGDFGNGRPKKIIIITQEYCLELSRVENQNNYEIQISINDINKSSKTEFNIIKENYNNWKIKNDRPDENPLPPAPLNQTNSLHNSSSMLQQGNPYNSFKPLPDSVKNEIIINKLKELDNSLKKLDSGKKIINYNFNDKELENLFNKEKDILFAYIEEDKDKEGILKEILEFIKNIDLVNCDDIKSKMFYSKDPDYQKLKLAESSTSKEVAFLAKKLKLENNVTIEKINPIVNSLKFVYLNSYITRLLGDEIFQKKLCPNGLNIILLNNNICLSLISYCIYDHLSVGNYFIKFHPDLPNEFLGTALESFEDIKKYLINNFNKIFKSINSLVLILLYKDKKLNLDSIQKLKEIINIINNNYDESTFLLTVENEFPQNLKQCFPQKNQYLIRPIVLEDETNTVKLPNDFFEKEDLMLFYIKLLNNKFSDTGIIEKLNKFKEKMPDDLKKECKINEKDSYFDIYSKLQSYKKKTHDMIFLQKFLTDLKTGSISKSVKDDFIAEDFKFIVDENITIISNLNLIGNGFVLLLDIYNALYYKKTNNYLNNFEQMRKYFIMNSADLVENFNKNTFQASRISKLSPGHFYLLLKHNDKFLIINPGSAKENSIIDSQEFKTSQILQKPYKYIGSDLQRFSKFPSSCGLVSYFINLCLKNLIEEKLITLDDLFNKNLNLNNIGNAWNFKEPKDIFDKNKLTEFLSNLSENKEVNSKSIYGDFELNFTEAAFSYLYKNINPEKIPSTMKELINSFS